MAHTLQIIHGSTTISFTTGDNDLLEYTPQDSGERVVTETALVSVKGSTVTDIQSTLESIKKSFELADRRYDKGYGDRVYVEFQPTGYSSAYRSEIVRPSVDVASGRIDHRGDTLGGRWAAKDLDVEVTWTRKNFWEKSSESELSLENGGGSGTGGQTVYNAHGTAVLSGETGISFADTNDRISDSGNGLGIFSSGDIISVRGSTSNDGIYSVEAVASTGNYLDINEDVLTDEAAGDSIDIYDIQNYVHIDSADIGGDLPAAIRIEFTNSDTGDTLETLWMGMNNTSAPLSFPHMLEVADSTDGSNSTGDFANGFKRNYTVTTSESKLTGWTLNTEMLGSAAGGYFKVFMRSPGGSNLTDVKFRLKLEYSNSVLWEGEQIEYDDTYASIAREIRVLDTVQLPPYIPESNTPEGMQLGIYGVSTTGSNESIDIDYVMLMPLDGHMRLRGKEGAVTDERFEADGIDKTIYVYNPTSTNVVNELSSVGMHMLIDPTDNNRIYFVYHSNTANDGPHDMSGSVRVYYRPRKVAL